MGRHSRMKWTARAKRAVKDFRVRELFGAHRKFRRALAKLGLTAALLLLWATPSSAIVVAQKDLPPPPCGCVWDIVNNPFDDLVQTAAEIEADKLHEGDPEWELSCREFIDIAIPFGVPPGAPPLAPPLVPTGVPTPFGPGGPGIPGQPPGPGLPGGPPCPGCTPTPFLPPVNPPVQTAEAATGILLLVGLCCGLFVPIRRT